MTNKCEKAITLETQSSEQNSRILQKGRVLEECREEMLKERTQENFLEFKDSDFQN